MSSVFITGCSTLRTGGGSLVPRPSLKVGEGLVTFL